jgi:hypothetical protein
MWESRKWRDHEERKECSDSKKGGTGSYEIVTEQRGGEEGLGQCKIFPAPFEGSQLYQEVPKLYIVVRGSWSWGKELGY